MDQHHKPSMIKLSGPIGLKKARNANQEDEAWGVIFVVN